MTDDVTYLPPTAELRAWASDPTANGFVPVFPATLRAIADELDSLRAKLRGADAFERGVNEALNSGDGSYRP